MRATVDFRRVFRGWSFAISAIVILSAIVPVEGVTRPLTPAAITTWIAGFALFGILLWIETASRERSRRARLLLITGESIAVLLMIWIATALGVEGVLFVLIAFQIGLLLPTGTALGWVIAQSAAMIAVLLPFGLHHVISLTAGFGPFQFLALFTSGLVKREIETRNELARSNAELRATQDLLADSNRASERFRISRELHDVFGHRLTALSLNLEIATVSGEPDRLVHLEKAYAITKSLLSDVRDVVENLRNGAHVDMARALETLTRDVPQPRIHIELPPTLLVDSGRQAHVLLRCAQEVVTNTMRHAGARNLWLQFATAEGGIEMTAVDDGRGAEGLRPGNGLRGIQQRLTEIGGTMEAGNAEGGGFRVRVVVPAA